MAHATPFPHIFSPLKIGPITVKNRLYNPPHGKSIGENNHPGERHLAYWEERAKGGIALIITEVESVHPTSRDSSPAGLSLRNWDDSIIPHYQKITSVIHTYDTKMFCQIYHSGQIASTFGYMPLWAASPIPSAKGPYAEVPKEMELEDIQEVIRAYGDAAVRAMTGGFDGVEIHISYWLPLTFLSSALNKRKDRYGGSLENRMRFLFEVVDEVYSRVGGRIAVGVRMNGDEARIGGWSLEEAKILCKNLEASGKIDFIDTTVGNPASEFTVPPMAMPHGYQLYVSKGIKEVVKKIPVFTVGRIVSPSHAERILADGHADMVGLVRALLADPEFPNKAREGRGDDIRQCVGANSCRSARRGHMPLRCIHNPTASKEREWGIGTLKPAAHKKRMLIVGGGPGGLEAARVAALRGHRVTLYEKEKKLGGQVNLAVKAPYREEFGGITEYLIRQIEKLGVDVHLGVEATPEVILAQKADAVIIATGSLPVKTGYSPVRADVEKLQGVDQPNVFTIWDVLQDKAELGEHIVFIDDNGHHEAAGTIEWLLDRGKKVEVVTRFNNVGAALEGTGDQQFFVPRVRKKGVVIHRVSWVEAIQDHTVRIYDLQTNEESTIQNVDSVVIAAGKVVNDSLYKALKGKVKELHRIGDCVAPRLVDHAIYEGHSLGRAL
ncbi:MAG: FAD-dependent oxidoreductase [Chloroflexi bacterium]|nr:FAD-dependent oxidoreductase [Chloroflexota bacterium]